MLPPIKRKLNQRILELFKDIQTHKKYHFSSIGNISIIALLKTVLQTNVSVNFQSVFQSLYPEVERATYKEYQFKNCSINRNRESTKRIMSRSKL